MAARMAGITAQSPMGPLQLPLSLPIGGWPTPSIPPTGGGSEQGSNNSGGGTAWARGLRAPASPPFEYVSSHRVSRCTNGNFYKPAHLQSWSRSLSPRPPTSARLPEAPSTASLSHRPSEFMGAVTPRRRPARLGSTYTGPKYAQTARLGGARASLPNKLWERAHKQTRAQKNAQKHKLWEEMRLVRHAKQRNAELDAYRFAFRLIDADKNGTVEAGEILMLLKTMGRSATAEGGFWAAFHELDGDHSNGLDFNEFSEVLDRIRGRKKADALLALQAGDRSPRGGPDSGEDEVAEKADPEAFASRADPNREGGGHADTAPGQAGKAVPLQRFPSVFHGGEEQVAAIALRPSTSTAAEKQDSRGEPGSRALVGREESYDEHPQPSSRPSTVGKVPGQEGNGTKFMEEALELRRQLLDVYCAVHKIRDVSLAKEIVDADDDGRHRTVIGRRLLDDEAAGIVQVDSDGLIPVVDQDSFEDIADMSISATGGQSNQKDKNVAQRQQHVRSIGAGVKARTKLAVRATYQRQTNAKEDALLRHLPGDLQQILDQFMALFESDGIGPDFAAPSTAGWIIESS